MNNKILNLILLGVIVFLVITNLKSCQDKDYLEQNANQN